MGHSPHNPQNPASGSNHSSDGDFDNLDRVHELTWALLDEHISDEEMAELESRLLADNTARDSYLRYAQMHADLATHFATPTEQREASKTATPVLGFLGEGLPTLGATQTNQPS